MALGVWLALASAVWGLRVATAGIYGRGEARVRIESSTNRIEKQQLFEQLWADIRRYDEQIAIVAADATSSHQADNLLGLKLICITAVEQYNAEARFVSSEQFRAADLPEQISASAHCKER